LLGSLLYCLRILMALLGGVSELVSQRRFVWALVRSD
jgi:hypothetical protein